MRNLTWIVIVVLSCLLITACDAWKIDSHGGSGEGCYTDGSCTSGLTCCNSICQATCNTDGDTDKSDTDGDTDTTDNDKEAEEDKESTIDGDEDIDDDTADTDKDTDKIDNDQEIDDDNDIETDIDEDIADTDNDTDDPDADEESETVEDDAESDMDTDSNCVCTTGDCCDGCNFLDTEQVCSQDVNATDEYRCATSDCGGNLEVKYKNQQCSGDSAECTGILIEGQWRIEDDCEETEKCNSELSQCVVDRPGCDSTYCQNGSGPCCDNDTNTLYDVDHACETDSETDYGCQNGETCGADVTMRYRDQYCTGSSAGCDGSMGSWKGWITADICGASEYCSPGSEICQIANTEASFSCYDEDVYWYDSCGVREDKKEECNSCDCSGNACVVNTQNTAQCYDDDVYWYDCHQSLALIKEDCGANGCYEGNCLTVPSFACADGVCNDPATGIDWQQEPGNKMEWGVAKTYCQALELEGDGWRLPNISELRSIIRDCSDIETAGACGVTDECSACGSNDACLRLDPCYEEAACNPSSCSDDGGVDGCYRPVGLGGECDTLWSSSAVEDLSGTVWGVNYSIGRLLNHVTHSDFPARCVRDPNCQNVASQDSYSCFDDDVYWYDSCGVREDKKEECDNCSCSGNACVVNTGNTAQCYDDDVYWYDCHGALASIKEDCEGNGCSEGECLSPPALSCLNGICTDPATNFEWQQVPTGGTMLWAEANNTHCTGLVLGGNGWRLPNISELRTLIRHCADTETDGMCAVKDECSACGVTANDICLTYNSCYDELLCSPTSCPTGCYLPTELNGTCSSYWSSSAVGDGANLAWHIRFDQGSINNYQTGSESYVRCVR